jgi:glycosidase
MEFHISRRAREKYQFDRALFSYSGNVIFADFHSVRVFAQKMNEQRDLITYPESVIKAGQLNAMGMIDEIFHHVFALYRQQKGKDTNSRLLSYLQEKLDKERLDSLLTIFISQFPPLDVYNAKITPKKYLTGKTEGTPNREMLLEELVLLWVATRNPALDNFSELFIDPVLIEDYRFDQVMFHVNEFFKTQPGFGPQNETLIDLLRSPAIQVPHSIRGQLEYIQTHWAALLGEYLLRLLSSLDLLKEENKLGGMGPGPVPIPVYNRAELLKIAGKDAEVEAFSPDREWMPRLVLIAKNTYVWLTQLSKQYQREITRLDQIPDEELQTLARRGITGLWLIGLWERSPASAKIKQLCGNPEAIASAYSLYSYDIALDLGGYGAYEALREQARRFGIRLASDMVPNHMGIDSDWVLHHPERFLALDHCPYPSYRFNGENLSSDPNVVIQIEDHYFDRSDAAVIFRRIDNNNGATRFIYHGNDGTSMPWNDTAQLNYLDPNVREVVIQTILQVARMFPIIRFDAAMTLAKKHIQRLWFPQPGAGGAIPSRSDFPLSDEEFNRAIPVEFWREVVDRVAKECPDTLLLAEAFWLMESYFVRTLGMHRVYNSAFMHMLRNEDNAGYRTILKNTLEFDPEILKRYVNFMNNPDERTAVEQFGKGDKYFGICTLMSTLPGLPMLGHGQVEGYSEKYGMEFRKPYWDESPDPGLIARHEAEIFPLLHQRELFAGVEHFWLYDFARADGVDENVFAFTNAHQGKRALVVYNNSFLETSGRLKTSASQAVRTGYTKQVKRTDIAKELELKRNFNAYLKFRDLNSSLWYLRPVDEVIYNGFSIHLNGYEHHVFSDFQVVLNDPNHDYGRLWSLIGQGGVPDIDIALEELTLQPVIAPWQQLMNKGYVEYLLKRMETAVPITQQLKPEFNIKMTHFLDGIAALTHATGNKTPILASAENKIAAIVGLKSTLKGLGLPGSKQVKKLASAALAKFDSERWLRVSLIAWAMTGEIGCLASAENCHEQSLSWSDEWHLGKALEETLKQMAFSTEEIQITLMSVRIASRHHSWLQELNGLPAKAILKDWLADPQIQYLLRVNRYNDILWYSREGFQTLVTLMQFVALLEAQKTGISASVLSEKLIELDAIFKQINALEKKSDYQVMKLVN